MNEPDLRVGRTRVPMDGGAGFVGSHPCENSVLRNRCLTCLHSLLQGCPAIHFAAAS